MSKLENTPEQRQKLDILDTDSKKQQNLLSEVKKKPHLETLKTWQGGEKKLPLETQSGPEGFSQSLFFHTTQHLDNIIRLGWLGNQSSLRKADPAYFEQAKRDSLSPVGKKMKWSPMAAEAKNLVFFSHDRVKGVFNKGASALVIPAVDLLADKPLFFRYGHNSGMPSDRYDSELCVSDTVHSNGQFSQKDLHSELQIPLEWFTIFVPTEEYESKKQLLLELKYDPDWIESHLMAFEGNVTDIVPAAQELYEHRLQELQQQELIFKGFRPRMLYFDPPEIENPLQQVTTAQ